MSGEKLVNLIGSFMKAKRAAEDRKLQRESDALTASVTRDEKKMQTKLAEVKMKEIEYKRNLLQGLMGSGGMNFGQPPQAAPVPQPGAADLMANPELINLHRSDMPVAQPSQAPQNQGSMNDMNPMHAVLIGEMTGLPILDVLKYGETRRNNQRLEDQGNRRIENTEQNNAFNQNLAGQETIQVPVTFADGSTGMARLPKYAGKGGGGGGGIPTSPAINDRMITPDDLPLWVKIDTMKVAPPGLTPTQATQKGYVKITEGQKTGVKDFAMIQNVLDRTDTLMRKVFPKKGGALDLGRLTRPVGAKLQTNTDAKLLQGFVSGTLAPVIRSLGEKGTLANQDVERAIQLMPVISDSADVAWGKLQQIRDLVQNNKQVFLGGLPGSGNQTVSGSTTKKSDYKYIPGKGMVPVQ